MHTSPATTSKCSYTTRSSNHHHPLPPFRHSFQKNIARRLTELQDRRDATHLHLASISEDMVAASRQLRKLRADVSTCHEEAHINEAAFTTHTDFVIEFAAWKIEVHGKEKSGPLLEQLAPQKKKTANDQEQRALGEDGPEDRTSFGEDAHVADESDEGDDIELIRRLEAAGKTQSMRSRNDTDMHDRLVRRLAGGPDNC